MEVNLQTVSRQRSRHIISNNVMKKPKKKKKKRSNGSDVDNVMLKLRVQLLTHSRRSAENCLQNI